MAAQATQFGVRPRVRSGYALKRLDEEEGARRWVLRDLERDGYLRLSDADAQLFELLDGEHSLSDLIGEAEARFGATGPARLARLIADLGERGFLAGVAGAEAGRAPAQSFLQRVVTPREKSFRGLGPWFEGLYRRGGWVLFTRPVLWTLAVLCVVGIGVFVELIVGRYGTPFVVADKLGLGGLVFLLGRFAMVAMHETAHGLAMASLGRRVDKAGLKLIVIFPFAFVDTSEAWFEPRRRRIAISAAGPVSDFALGGAVLDLLPAAGGGHGARHLLPARLRAPTSAPSSTSTRSSSATATTCSSTGCGSLGCGAARASSSRAGCRARGSAETDSPVLARYSLWGIAWLAARGGLRDRHDLALRAVPDGRVPGFRRVCGGRHAVPRVLRARPRGRRQAAGGSCPRLSTRSPPS